MYAFDYQRPASVKDACLPLFGVTGGNKTNPCTSNASCIGLATQCAIDECVTAGPLGSVCKATADCLDGAACIGGTCSAKQCVADNLACATGAECCGGTCSPDGLGGGKCAPLNGGGPATGGNPCVADGDCASKFCNNGVCTASSFCGQTGEECSAATDCCGGLCTKKAGATLGVCGLVTPWNWPINQIMAKVAPALVSGCTVVLKPSEQAPLSAQLVAEFIDEARLPPGVFNMVHGSGSIVGHAMSAHPKIDLMSFTGSTRAGVDVARTSADTVKRVTQELGGKSPNIVFADVDLEKAIKRGVIACFGNTGQSCNAPTRMLVEDSVYDRAVEIAARVAGETRVDDPSKPGRHMGPLASRMQFEKVQKCIAMGIEEGARLVAGGLGRPGGFNRGFYVQPTVFADVHNQMRIAREEIFGPVLSMLRFKTQDDAILSANDTPYGLAAYQQTDDLQKAHAVARQLRAGSVHINGASQGYAEPFGGYRQSGNGRECGVYGLLEFLELKSINGYYAA